MTIAPADTPVYTDLKGLSSLKRGAAMKDPAAIRKVAQQFESMFTRMMLKSMRDAAGTDPMFGSDQQKMYQDMADDQLSVQLSKGKGLGLADMLIRQLQKMGVAGAGTALHGGTSHGVGTSSSINGNATDGIGATAGSAKAAAAYSATQHTTSSTLDPARTRFIDNLWPHAQQAGEQLGVDPRNLLAQAALETNWGRNLPQDAAGRSSHNLFGIKASGTWPGATVTTTTQEFQGGLVGATTATFRAYSSPAQSFQDYVALLRSNPRYVGALNTGSDATAFASGLQRGGYATDPDYVQKITAIAQTIDTRAPVAAAIAPTGLKLADSLPLTGQTGAL